MPYNGARQDYIHSEKSSMALRTVPPSGLQTAIKDLFGRALAPHKMSPAAVLAPNVE